MKRKTSISISIIGDSFCDIMVTNLEKLPSWGADVLSNSPFEILAGGSALNSAIQLSNLINLYDEELLDKNIVMDVKLHTIIGDDNYGTILKNATAKHHVKLFSPTIENGSSGVCLCLCGHEDRAFITHRGVSSIFSLKHLNLEELYSSSHVHIAGFYNYPNLWNHLPNLLKNLQSQGITTSLSPQFDASEEWKYVQDSLPFIDIFLPNEVEAKEIAKNMNINQNIPVLHVNLPASKGHVDAEVDADVNADIDENANQKEEERENPSFLHSILVEKDMIQSTKSIANVLRLYGHCKNVIVTIGKDGAVASYSLAPSSPSNPTPNLNLTPNSSSSSSFTSSSTTSSSMSSFISSSKSTSPQASFFSPTFHQVTKGVDTIVDATGAGDAFCAGFLFRYVQDLVQKKEKEQEIALEKEDDRDNSFKDKDSSTSCLSCQSSMNETSVNMIEMEKEQLREAIKMGNAVGGAVVLKVGASTVPSKVEIDDKRV